MGALRLLLDGKSRQITKLLRAPASMQILYKQKLESFYKPKTHEQSRRDKRICVHLQEFSRIDGGLASLCLLVLAKNHLHNLVDLGGLKNWWNHQMITIPSMCLTFLIEAELPDERQIGELNSESSKP